MVEILKLKLMKLMLNQDSEIVICSSFVSCALLSCDMNSTLGSVVPLAMFVVVVPKGTVVTIIDPLMNILS